ncbi:PAS domain S-box protein [Gracilimonas halophila]|uniref:PAS domain S-box protein n=1 Tax=Gracilimonas halophila TaxID=1834464 RepID=A0ABW5JIQ6_9BACT
MKNSHKLVLHGITNICGREIIFTNDAFTKFTGYSEEEVTGKTLHF